MQAVITELPGSSYLLIRRSNCPSFGHKIYQESRKYSEGPIIQTSTPVAFRSGERNMDCSQAIKEPVTH